MIARYVANGCLVLALFLAGIAGAEVEPTARRFPVRSLSEVVRHELPPVDVAAALVEDEFLRAAGDPERFALPEDVFLTPDSDGTWEELPAAGLVLWRLRVSAPGCLSLNLGFERYRLPDGGRLVLHAADGNGPVHEFTAGDNAEHGQLWTPLIESDEIVLELTLPGRSRHDADLWLTRVGKGYRPLGGAEPDKAGACNIDVVCPEGDEWREEIPAVGVYTVAGVWKCTGTLVNNTAEDLTPYFLTAAHCGVTAAAAPAVVVYWNYESPVCGDQGGGSLANSQSGAIHRATWSDNDLCLIELAADPDPALNLSWAGWSRVDAAPDSAVAIHHPSTDEKSISFESDPLEITDYLGYVPVDGNYLRVVDWDLGTTEPGSSGSALFDPDHRIIGHLHGGYAACGNDASDWYGRIAVGWEGGGTADTRLKDWLDPLGDEPLYMDTFAPWAGGMRVSPAAGLVSQGDWGGPFSPTSRDYQVENRGQADLDYGVTADQAWVEVTGGSGTLVPGASTTVTVMLGAGANDLNPGFYTAEVTFSNLTDGGGDTTRPVSLQVGSIETHYEWNLDEDPGWQMEGDWAFGVPWGWGGATGNPDPTTGFTGANVLGYNLLGDYPAFLAETSLTTGPIDCRTLQGTSLRFRRWLGVQSSNYDHAYVRASTDSLDWVTVWSNTSAVTDDAWQLVELDLGAVADGQQTLYLRWVMGTTNFNQQYCGWNIDDIEILGLSDPTVGIDDREDDPPLPRALPERLAVRTWPNPFNPRTTVAFDLPRAQHVLVSVHDATGKRVRVLYDDRAATGTTEVVWDGLDAAGRRQASGIYFVRVAGEFDQVTRKVSMLK